MFAVVNAECVPGLVLNSVLMKNHDITVDVSIFVFGSFVCGRMFSESFGVG